MLQTITLSTASLQTPSGGHVWSMFQSTIKISEHVNSDYTLFILLLFSTK